MRRTALAVSACLAGGVMFCLDPEPPGDTDPQTGQPDERDGPGNNSDRPATDDVEQEQDDADNGAAQQGCAD